MKKYLALALFSVLLIVLCGAPPEGEKKEETAEEISYQPLSAAELQKFVTAFPVFKTEIEKKSEGWEKLESAKNFGAWLGQFSRANEQIAGLDKKLKDAGMAWEEFWPAFAKTMMTFSAVMYDSGMAEMRKSLEEQEGEIAEMEAKLKDPKITAQEKEMITASLEMIESMKQSLAEAENVFAKVPDANKELVKNHLKKLTTILEVED